MISATTCGGEARQAASTSGLLRSPESFFPDPATTSA